MAPQFPLTGVLRFLISAAFVFYSLVCSSNACASPAEAVQDDTLAAAVHFDVEAHGGAGEHVSGEPAIWSVAPFVILLLMIATGPLFYPHFWHRFYPLIAIALGSIVVVYYLAFLHDYHHPVHSLAEYVSFISLLTALFVASGGILIEIDYKGVPWVNVIILVTGAAIANIIGTTGASMLLIRPYIRLNKDHIRAYHIVFFIFMVSNVGGCLTPIGDPPLFLGFLKGVPFFWTLQHLWIKWFFGIGLLAVVFYFLDRYHYSKSGSSEENFTGRIVFKGSKNIFWLVVTIGAVFLDPGIFPWLPAIPYHGDRISFLREAIMLLTAYLAYRTSDAVCLKKNEFNFEPIREVAYLFIGIFATMMPALQLISTYAQGHQAAVTEDTLYWATGLLSSVLDNAPTYLNFLAAGLGDSGLSIMNKADVRLFASSAETIRELIAISISAVFFGACTYIGNAPNFMVKSIAEQAGIEMPSFVGYVIRYTIPFLFPVLILTWLIFIHWGIAV
ncbi:MAG: citrate transporter [Chitinophagales bacterium]|nr:MAG: citrate transporter [Chitinophagales bacterium]